MYWRDHLPAHFHAGYGEFEALVSIEGGEVLEGKLPAKRLKLVLAWCEIHRDELLKNWQLGQEDKTFFKIAPLR